MKRDVEKYADMDRKGGIIIKTMIERVMDKDYDIELINANADVGGGTITKDDIDVLKDYPRAKSVKISGLHQDTFDYFISEYGRQFKSIIFFKNKLVGDLSALGNLPDIEHIYYFANQRAERLWDMSGNKSLIQLEIKDFSRLHTLDDVANAPNLQSFDFGNEVWSTSKFESLKPLANSSLRELCFNCAKILDNNVSYLAQIPHLEQLDFSTNLFSTEQIAWLAAHLPNVKGYALRAYVDCSDDNGVLICGKRKPILTKGKDDVRIKRYADKFDKLVEEYRNMSYKEVFEMQ